MTLAIQMFHPLRAAGMLVAQSGAGVVDKIQASKAQLFDAGAYLQQPGR